MPAYRLIPVDMPRWKVFAEQLRESLDVKVTESAEFVGVPYLVFLPDVLHVDYDLFARQVGWTPGQVLGFLALQGALRLAELSERHEEGKL